ncbi:hypothetical protein PN836_019980 [Ningiella sp. W23]|uniref:hypothetical protein n=1 Tax=Ningiella sp. W23 TaxID=3023715 RepID=UPI0039F58ADB
MDMRKMTWIVLMLTLCIAPTALSKAQAFFFVPAEREASRSNSFKLTSPTINAQTARSDYKITTPAIVARAKRQVYKVTAPSLLAEKQAQQFELTTPLLSATNSHSVLKITSKPLTAIATPRLFAISTSRLSAFMLEENANAATVDSGHKNFPFASPTNQRLCPHLYTCAVKHDVRNAKATVANSGWSAQMTFCEAVQYYLGETSHCPDQAFLDAMNFDFGLNGLLPFTDCPAIHNLQKTLQQMYTDGESTYAAEQKIMQIVQRNMVAMLSGNTDAVCKAFSDEAILD